MNFLCQERLHWAEYFAEFLGTSFNIFIGLSAVVFDSAPELPMQHFIPDKSIRLLITGLIFSGSGALVAISPLGRLSGGHINPSVTLAFWVQGKMHHQDIFGYIFAQFSGAILGSLLLTLVWGRYAASVYNGMTIPGVLYPIWVVFIAETSITFLLVLAIFVFVCHPNLMPWTPLMTWLLIAIMVCIESPISGTSLNTARSFGPAFVTKLWKDQWIYWIAPPLGSLFAVVVFRLFSQHDILTGKLFHLSQDPSIFKNVEAPHLLKN